MLLTGGCPDPLPAVVVVPVLLVDVSPPSVVLVVLATVLPVTTEPAVDDAGGPVTVVDGTALLVDVDTAVRSAADDCVAVVASLALEPENLSGP